MSPARIGLLACAVTSVWFFVLSGLLGAVPGEPVGSRIDAYIQADAGGRIADAANGAFGRAVVVHPFFDFVFTLPISKLAWLLSGLFRPELAALYACRLYAAAAGIGVGRLSAALARFGVSPLPGARRPAVPARHVADDDRLARSLRPVGRIAVLRLRGLPR